MEPTSYPKVLIRPLVLAVVIPALASSVLCRYIILLTFNAKRFLHKLLPDVPESYLLNINNRK